MFTCHPQEKIIVEFIKMTPFKSLHTLNSSYSVVLWMIHSCVFVFRDSCSRVPLVLNSSTVCCSSEKSFSSHKFFGFPALCIWTLSNNNCMILRSIFSHRGLRDSYASITEDSNTHWCSRRRIHALRARARLPPRSAFKSFNVQLAVDYSAYSMVICQVIDKLKLVLLFNLRVCLAREQRGVNSSFHWLIMI